MSLNRLSVREHEEGRGNLKSSVEFLDQWGWVFRASVREDHDHLDAFRAGIRRPIFLELESKQTQMWWQ